MHTRCISAFGSAVLLALLGVSLSAQASAPSATPQSAPAAPSSSSKGRQKYSHADDYLIRGTVFTDKAFAFAGAELRIRRAGDKKFRWHDYTNSRGEFAIRVPQGSQYEMVVRAKGFADQTQTIDAQGSGGDHNLVFRLQRVKGEKK